MEQHGEILVDIYSIDYLLRCNVLDLSQQIIKLSPVCGKTDMFQKYDPVVLVANDAGNITATAADVTGIDRSSESITLSIRKYEVPEEERVFERYPASLMISARKKYLNKRIHMLVKSISLYGLEAISEVELDEEECIDMDLITRKNMFYFSGKVICKKQLDSIFEYGLQFTHYDVATRYLFQDYLTNQASNYSNMIPRAK